MVELFQPMITLCREPDGKYTLYAVTLTPNSCFSAGLAQPSPPPNVLIIPEVQPVSLNIHRRSGLCLQTITPVRQALANLQLGSDTGKTSVTAFVLLHDGSGSMPMLVGSASIRVDDAAHVCMADPDMQGHPNSHSWTAIADLEPPEPSSLTVRGMVTVAHPGHEAVLSVAEPQGFNPAQLILDLELRELPGIWPQVITDIEAVYRDDCYRGKHDTVAIQHKGAILTVIPIVKAL